MAHQMDPKNNKWRAVYWNNYAVSKQTGQLLTRTAQDCTLGPVCDNVLQQQYAASFQHMGSARYVPPGE
uniref:Uncharacterized protein n=1 Tax=Romanomermis culicivorax TaxID=13658 RepID=A0A915J4F6_ROMCU